MEAAATLQWYEQGNWPLVGAIVVLLITNAIALWQVIYQTNRSLSDQLRLKKIEFLSQQLSEFYNPIYSMMCLNKNIFGNFGPQSFPQEEIFRQAAGKNWELLRDKVILPNNTLIVELLKNKSHLISSNDDIKEYLNLNNHLVMYEVFTEYPTEVYKKCHFPPDILLHIENKRNELVQLLNKLKR